MRTCLYCSQRPIGPRATHELMYLRLAGLEPVLVARQIAITWPELRRIRRVTKLRFKRPIRPGDDLVLQITRPDRERVDFDVRCGTERCSSGTLHFEV